MALDPPVTFPLGTTISASSVPLAVNCQLWSLVEISVPVAYPNLTSSGRLSMSG